MTSRFDRFFNPKDGTYANVPKGWVLHTPEEKADAIPVTPYYFQTPNLSASTHYFVATNGDVYQMVREKWSPKCFWTRVSLFARTG